MRVLSNATRINFDKLRFPIDENKSTLHTLVEKSGQCFSGLVIFHECG